MRMKKTKSLLGDYGEMKHNPRHLICGSLVIIFARELLPMQFRLRNICWQKGSCKSIDNTQQFNLELRTSNLEPYSLPSSLIRKMFPKIVGNIFDNYIRSSIPVRGFF